MRNLLSLLFVAVISTMYFVPSFAATSTVTPAASVVTVPSAVAPAPAVAAVASDSTVVAVSPPVSSGKLIAMILACVVSLNILLSAVQQICAKFSLTEPGWLQSASSIVLSVAKVLGSNPSVDAKAADPKV